MTQVQLGEKEVRMGKIKKLLSMWIHPYAQSFKKEQYIENIIKEYWDKELREIESIIEKPEVQVSTAWRVMLYRSHGKLAFAKILDSTNQIQLMFHRDQCKILKTTKWENGKMEDVAVESLEFPESETWTMTAYKFMEKMVDIGDFIGVKWEVFKTHKWELTIFVSEFKFLSKAIRPLPEKFHGLSDQEDLYRKRYLDMTMNPESYARFLFKSQFYKTLREFYFKHGFTEIQTPILDNAASWAAARPFITHHNDYDADVYLRIAFETSLKKATVWRFERVFEIGQDFRNEWSDPSHLQEFTQVEHYAVYWNYEDNMRFTEEMFDYLFDNLGISRQLKVKDKDWVEREVDFTTPWERIDYTKGIYDACWISAEAWKFSKYNSKVDFKLKNDPKSFITFLSLEHHCYDFSL